MNKDRENINSPSGNSHISAESDEDLAALNQVEELGSGNREKEIEADFERILAASRRSAQ